MRLAPQQLDGALSKGLVPICLIFGDEPLQLAEAAETVRRRAREAGFTERTCIDQQGQLDWSEVTGEANAMSLFAERRLIELRLSSDGVGNDGAAAIRRYCERPPEDVLLLILAPKLDWKATKSKWAQALDKAGALVQVRALEGRALGHWLDARLRARGLEPTREAVALLAERVEGNLLAADQEIAKLALLREPGPLDAEALLAAVHDSARYDLFDLTDAALAGDRARADRVLRALRAEGTAAPLVLWVLAREIRKLAAVAFALSRRGDLAKALKAHQVWESRRDAVVAAARRYPVMLLWRLLARCADADLAIKGRLDQDPWRLFAEILDALARPPPRSPA